MGQQDTFRVAITRLGTLIGLLLALGQPGLAHHGPHPRAEPAPTETETTPPVSELLDVYECTRCHRLTTPNRLIEPSL